MRNSLPDALSTGNFSFSHCLNFSFSKADGAVSHAACSREGGDGGGEHRDDDLNGLLLDERPHLLAQFVEDFHGEFVFIYDLTIYDLQFILRFYYFMISFRPYGKIIQ